MFSVWERFPDIAYELPNGKTIRVDEWRKETKRGLAVIRSGYMRIDNCPRFQVVVLFNNHRVMTDRPMFRNFNDALEAADEWIANLKSKPIKAGRRLTALPSPDSLAGGEPSMPKPARIQHVPILRPRIKAQPRPQMIDFGRQRCHHSKLDSEGSAKLDKITVQEYHRLDFARSSLRELHSNVSILMGLDVTIAMVQQRLAKHNLSYKVDKKKAIERAKPIVKEAIRQVLIAYPDYGARKCHYQLNKTEHNGYRFKLVDEMYRELRKESNTKAPTHPRRY